jgi:hypothetical protein
MHQMFLVNSGIYNREPFQSGLLFKDPIKIQKIFIDMIEDDIEQDMMDDDYLSFHYINQLAYMIRAEKVFFSDYVVFYRTVGVKYVVYEVYSLLISLLDKTSRDNRILKLNEMLSRERDGASLKWDFVCTNSIMDYDYVQDMNSLIESIDVDASKGNDSNDSHVALLSANCTLHDKNGHSSFAFNYICDRETGPFWSGYEGKCLFRTCIDTVFKICFGYSDENAIDIVLDKIRQAFETQCRYTKSTSDMEIPGHMIQIFLPRQIVDAFTYPCIAWGYKVDVFQMQDGKIKGEVSRLVDKHNIKPHIDRDKILRPVPFSELLMTEHLGNVQARIYGHKDLYLRHGAFCRVYNGCPGFDSIGFRHQLVTILAPWLHSLFEKY